ncbi:MAG TPA: helix-hairpin-helix domain-containing protein [Terriglobia bacterium]|nr:helix-hairpin-helix domain-containing protein [Terriglobia bacterium]
MLRLRGEMVLRLLLLCLLGGNAASSPLNSVKEDDPRSSPQTLAIQGSKVNINRATFEELQALPGIGPGMAQRIVEYRKKNPPFRKVEDLLIIRGISRTKLEKLRDRVKVE